MEIIKYYNIIYENLHTKQNLNPNFVIVMNLSEGIYIHM